jgi:hypothetical protein
MSDSGSPASPTDAPGSLAEPVYRDRMTPTIGIWVAAASFAMLFGVAALIAGVGPGVGTFVVVFGLEAAFLISTAPRVEVADGMFVAGGARIPVSLLGPAQALDAEAWHRAIGLELDPRAFLCMRGWVRTGVRVPLQDPNDPTPYWLVASARPTQLVAALATARHPA